MEQGITDLKKKNTFHKMEGWKEASEQVRYKWCEIWTLLLKYWFGHKDI